MGQNGPKSRNHNRDLVFHEPDTVDSENKRSGHKSSDIARD